MQKVNQWLALIIDVIIEVVKGVPQMWNISNWVNRDMEVVCIVLALLCKLEIILKCIILKEW